jgi:hypothetical protein
MARSKPTGESQRSGWTFTANRLPDGRPERYFPDIPARDLSGDEVGALDDEQRERALASGLYRDADADED